MSLWLLFPVLGVVLYVWLTRSTYRDRVGVAVLTIRRDAPRGGLDGKPAEVPVRRDLPAAARAWLERVGDGGRREPVSLVEVRQRGEMRLAPDRPWMPYEAVQTFSATYPAFAWSARVGQGWKAVHVLDEFDGRAGTLEARVGAVVKVAGAEGVEASGAQLARYLAEVVWVPWALDRCRALEVEQAGPGTLRLTARAGEAMSTVLVELDEAGDPVRVTGTRSRTTPDGPVPTEFRAELSDFGDVGGFRLPRRGEIAWLLEEGPFPYWRGEVLSVEVH